MMPREAVTQLDERRGAISGRTRSYYTLVEEVYDFAPGGASSPALLTSSAKDWARIFRITSLPQISEAYDEVCPWSGRVN